MKHLNPNLDNITNIEVDKAPVGDVRAIGIDDNNDIVLSSTDGGLMVPEGAPVTTPSSTTSGIVCSGGTEFVGIEEGSTTTNVANPTPNFNYLFFDRDISQVMPGADLSAANTVGTIRISNHNRDAFGNSLGAPIFTPVQEAILNAAGIVIPTADTDGNGGNQASPNTTDIHYLPTPFIIAFYSDNGSFAVTVNTIGVRFLTSSDNTQVWMGGSVNPFAGTDPEQGQFRYLLRPFSSADFALAPEGTTELREQSTFILNCTDPVRGDVSETPTTTVGPNGITTQTTSCVIGPDTTTLTTVPVRSTTGWGGWTAQGPSELPTSTLLTQDRIHNIEINAEDSLVSVAGGGGQVYPPPQAPNPFDASALQLALFTSLGLVEATLQAQAQGGQSIVNAPADFTAFNTRFVTADGAEFTVLVSSAYFSRGSTKLYLGGTGDAPASGPASSGTGFRNFTTEDFTISPSGTYNVSTTNNTAPFDFDQRIDSTVDVDIVCTAGPSTTIAPGDLTTTGDINVGGDLTVTGDTNIVPNAGTVPASWDNIGTTINPTDNVLPVRTSATTFGDSLIRHVPFGEEGDTQVSVTGAFGMDVVGPLRANVLETDRTSVEDTTLSGTNLAVFFGQEVRPLNRGSVGQVLGLNASATALEWVDTASGPAVPDFANGININAGFDSTTTFNYTAVDAAWTGSAIIVPAGGQTYTVDTALASFSLPAGVITNLPVEFDLSAASNGDKVYLISDNTSNSRTDNLEISLNGNTTNALGDIELIATDAGLGAVVLAYGFTVVEVGSNKYLWSENHSRFEALLLAPPPPIPPTGNSLTQTAGAVFPAENTTVTGSTAFTATVTDDDLTDGTYQWRIGGTTMLTSTHGDTNTVMATNGTVTLTAVGNTMTYVNTFALIPNFAFNSAVTCVFTDNTNESITSNSITVRWRSA